MKTHWFVLLGMWVLLGCKKSNKTSTATKSDTLMAINTVKSVHFDDLDSSKWVRSTLEENDTIAQIFYVPLGFDTNLDSVKREFGEYSIKKNKVYFSDLNGDKLPDALVEFSFSPYGGNVYESYFAVLINERGRLTLTDSVKSGSSCSDPILKIDSIARGTVYVSGVGFKSDDSCCCPSQLINQQYVLKKNQLILK